MAEGAQELVPVGQAILPAAAFPGGSEYALSRPNAGLKPAAARIGCPTNFVVLAIGMGCVLCAAEAFRARLAPVAIDAATKANVTGSGSLTAVLTGSKLAVNGKFDGLRSPATVAHIHEGPATGVRGAAILELSVSKATSGVISGSFDLTPEQVERLRKGRLYVQIHSAKAPEGNLWGWLLK